MTWTDLRDIIDNMPEDGKRQEVVVWDSNGGKFFKVKDCTEFSLSEPGKDFSLDIDTFEGWM